MQKDKEQRQREVLRLVQNERINRQEELRGRLRKLGFEVTQATLSRDFRELKIVKAVDGSGMLRYQRLPEAEDVMPVRCRASGNLLVFKTQPGMAAPLAYRIDGLKLSQILGTVAGEDTVLAVVAENSEAEQVKSQLLEMIGKR